MNIKTFNDILAIIDSGNKTLIDELLVNNICLLSDSYKFGHWRMMPKGSEYVYSYFEARNGAKYPVTVFEGLQD